MSIVGANERTNMWREEIWIARVCVNQVNENEEWKEISELEFMDGFYKLYHRVTPAIKEMIEGKELRTPDAVYRLKWQFGNSRMTKVSQNRLSPV